MFKRTNKAWKALALVLALCMLSSTVALADGEATVSTATLSDVTANYAEATQTATVTGKIDAKGNDVTILAVRGAAAATEENLAVWSADDLQGMVTYIDQDTSSTEDGSFSFSFIPGRGTGGVVTVFVGGEDVDDIVVKTFEAKMPAPGLVAQEKWYEGDNTVEFTLKKADLSAAYNGDLNAWWEAVDKVNVKIGEADAVDMKSATHFADGVLTIDVTAVTGVEIKEITITTTANAYFDATWNAGVKQVKKTPGTLTAPTAAVVAGTNAEITVTSEDTTWTGALETSTFIGDAPDAAMGVDYESGVLSVPMTIASDKLEDSVVVTVKQNYYTDATATINVVAPTKAAADDATATLNYSTERDADTDEATANDSDVTAASAEWKSMYGAAVVTLATPADDSLTYAWTVSSTDGGADATINNNDASVTLDRPNYVASEAVTDETPKAYTYTLTLTVTKDGYKEATNTFTVSVSRVGMKGANIEITPNFTGDTSAAIAALATYTLTPKAGGTSITITVADDGKFTASAVALGDYTLTIARPGYVTQTVDVTVGSTGLETFEMPAMVAGDTDDDGKIHADDYMNIVNAWRNQESTLGDAFPHNCDINGDGYVHADDYMAIVNNWRYGM